MSRSFGGVSVYYYRCLNCECAYTVKLRDEEEDLHNGVWEPLQRPSQRCQECHEPTSDLTESGLCVLCDRWRSFSAIAQSENLVRVKGHHYVIEDEDDTPLFGLRGFGGQTFTIRFFDGRAVTTTNLWAQGPIPEHFRERLPDNAEFVGREPMVVTSGKGKL